VTLRRFLRELAHEELGTLAPTSPEATRLLVARLRELGPRHAHALDRTIGVLRRAGTTRAALARSGVPRGKYFAELLGDLDRALEARSLYDDRAAPWAAARRLQRADALGTTPDGPAVVRGLSSWDNATLAMLEALDQRLRERGHDGVTLELPDMDAEPLRDAVGGLASELEARWADRQHSPSLLFAPTPSLSSNRVDWVEAQDAESEARVVARLVVEALARGTPLDRIAIVPVKLEEAFLEPLRFELTRARIPFAEPRGRPAIASPRAHAAIELLRIARGPLGRDALVDVLRVPELRQSRWFTGHGGALGELLHEISTLPLRVDRSGNDLADELADQLAEIRREDPEQAERLEPARAGLMQWLEELRGLSIPGSRQHLIHRALALFEALGLLGVSERTLARALDAARAGQPELLAALGHDAAGARAVRTALERLAAATSAIGADSDVVDLATLLEELEFALEGVSPTGGAVRAGAVRIARPSQVAALRLEHVLLCRASDATLDVANRDENGLGSELENKLPAAERPVGGATEQRFALLAVSWAVSAAKRVTVTWASHAGMRPVAPSRLVRWIRQAGISGRKEPGSPLLAGARPAHVRKKPSEGALHRIAVERRRSDFFSDPSAPVDEYNGGAGSLAAFVGGNATRPLSVTALERSIRCPYLGFTSIVLRASAVDPVEDAISARERGNLLHAALAAALEAVRELWGRRSPRELEALAFERARVLVEQRGRSPLRRAGLRSTLLDVACLLRFVFSEDSGFEFRLAEQAFGMDGGWPALAVGGQLVAGRADRIDLGGGGRRVRVIDYKTRLPTRAEQQRALQPALYALKAGTELGADEVEFAYLALQGRGPQQRVIFESSLDGEPIRDGVARAASTIQTLESGILPPRPAATSYCVRCASRDICRRPLSAPESIDP